MQYNIKNLEETNNNNIISYTNITKNCHSE